MVTLRACVEKCTGMPGHEKFVLYPHNLAKARELIVAIVTGLVAANAVWNLIGLTRIG